MLCLHPPPTDGGHSYDSAGECRFGCGCYRISDKAATTPRFDIDPFGSCPNSPVNQIETNIEPCRDASG